MIQVLPEVRWVEVIDHRCQCQHQRHLCNADSSPAQSLQAKPHKSPKLATRALPRKESTSLLLQVALMTPHPLPKVCRSQCSPAGKHHHCHMEEAAAVLVQTCILLSRNTMVLRTMMVFTIVLLVAADQLCITVANSALPFQRTLQPW